MAEKDDKPRWMSEYAAENWKSHPEAEGTYEQERFESSASGRAKNRREKAMVKSFLDHLPPQQTVLDVPAGMGRFTELIVERGHRPISMDLHFGRAQTAYRRLAKRVLSAQADVFHLPLQNDSVDAVVCFRLLHHLPLEAIAQVLEELRRVANRAYVTFYCLQTFKYWKKRLRGKAVSGCYYSTKSLIELSNKVGWRSCRHEPSFGFFQILHALELQR
jgi:ubiquinone/menaquinone biosynthesis C-methylase UbiE